MISTRFAVVALVACLAAACASTQDTTYVAASHTELSDQMTAVHRGQFEMRGAFNVMSIEGGDFSLGDVKEGWDDAWRYELDFLYNMPRSGSVEPFANAFLYYEDRKWKDGPSSVDYDVIGFGIGTGAAIWAMERPGFALGLKPYVRLGMGFQNGKFEAIPSSRGISEGSISYVRVEGSIGLDLEARIGQRIVASIGGGFAAWSSVDQDATTRDGSTTWRYDNLRFKGQDAYFRVGLGINF